jgi:hypothetical protein
MEQTWWFDQNPEPVPRFPEQTPEEILLPLYIISDMVTEDHVERFKNEVAEIDKRDPYATFVLQVIRSSATTVDSLLSTEFSKSDSNEQRKLRTLLALDEQTTVNGSGLYIEINTDDSGNLRSDTFLRLTPGRCLLPLMHIIFFPEITDYFLF